MAKLEFFDVTSEAVECALTRTEDLASQPGSPFRERLLHIEASEGLRLPNGTRTLLQRRVAGPVPRGTWGPYDLLDNEIRTGLHLVRRFGVDPAPAEISCLVGYDVDAQEPFALLLPYAGEPVRKVAGRLTLEQQRGFEAGFFRALRLLDAAQVVHGRLSPESVRWDERTGRVQVVDFCRAVLAAEPRMAADPSPWASPEQVAGLGNATMGDDVWSAGAVTYYVTTGRQMTAAGKTVGLAGRSVTVQPLLDGVFENLPAARPTVARLLQRLHESDPWLGYEDANPLFVAGEHEFDQLMADKWPAAVPSPAVGPVTSVRQPPIRPIPARRPPARRTPVRWPFTGPRRWQVWVSVALIIGATVLIAARVL